MFPLPKSRVHDMRMPFKIAEMKSWKCGTKGHLERVCKEDRKEEEANKMRRR